MSKDQEYIKKLENRILENIKIQEKLKHENSDFIGLLHRSLSCIGISRAVSATKLRDDILMALDGRG